MKNRDSELKYLTGHLGIYGETREEVIRRAVDEYGHDSPLRQKGETAGDMFRAVFGGSKA